MNTQVVALIHAIGGRLGWRYWWPIVPLLVDVFLVTVMGQQRSTNSSSVLFLVSLATVALVWLWGARFAIALGYRRPRVYPVALTVSLLLPVGWQLIGVSVGAVFGGQTWHELGFFLLYGLPMVGLLVLGCCLWLGYNWLGAGIALGSWAVVAGLLFFVVWPMLAATPVVQIVVATVVVVLILGGSIWGGWQGFKVARA